MKYTNRPGPETGPPRPCCCWVIAKKILQAGSVVGSATLVCPVSCHVVLLHVLTAEPLSRTIRVTSVAFVWLNCLLGGDCCWASWHLSTCPGQHHQPAFSFPRLDTLDPVTHVSEAPAGACPRRLPLRGTMGRPEACPQATIQRCWCDLTSAMCVLCMH